MSTATFRPVTTTCTFVRKFSKKPVGFVTMRTVPLCKIKARALKFFSCKIFVDGFRSGVKWISHVNDNAKYLTQATQFDTNDSKPFTNKTLYEPFMDLKNSNPSSMDRKFFNNLEPPNYRIWH